MCNGGRPSRASRASGAWASGAICSRTARTADARAGRGIAGDLDGLLEAALRGKEVTSRILRFSRRQALELGAIDLVSTVEDGARLLRAALPANVRIELDLDRPNPVIADAASVHAVLMNLGTNALHAMPDGGVLRITLAPFYARDSFVRSHPGLAEGHYVKMSVTDSGAGMDEETSRRAFEPFFTTKPLGTGTGLGLSTVHGVMRDHAGAVWIDSALGRGTSVHCLFPAVIRELERDAAEAPAASLGTASACCSSTTRTRSRSWARASSASPVIRRLRRSARARRSSCCAATRARSIC
jgi:signal transduction histidine kinase